MVWWIPQERVWFQDTRIAMHRFRKWRARRWGEKCYRKADRELKWTDEHYAPYFQEAKLRYRGKEQLHLCIAFRLGFEIAHRKRGLYSEIRVYDYPMSRPKGEPDAGRWI